ncbi:hypothetical protein [Serinicoccus marinus]|nr:hypothetical protein [Serinicoccus marinus]
MTGEGAFGGGEGVGREVSQDRWALVLSNSAAGSSEDDVIEQVCGELES